MATDERKTWFKKRVGRRIFRTELSYGSPADQRIHKEGQIIYNQEHADWLYEREKAWKKLEFGVTYFGSQDERDKAELKQLTPAI